jgi:glycosyltransferase involved in cell wall biosynthesis
MTLKFSVVINTIDRVESLTKLLRALEHQSYQDFEVIVVVGPTNDNTIDALREYEDRIRLIRCLTANLSVSRNLGLRAAAGDIVAYIDDDAIPSRNWLAQLNYIFTSNPHIAATGGSVYLIHPFQPMIQHSLGIFSVSGKQYDVRYNLLDHLPIEGPGEFWTMRMMGTNMAYRREALLAIGGFDELYEWVYDDSEIALRLSAAGFLVRPVREARVYHVPASNRNRKIFTFLVKWWINTKAATYLSILYWLRLKSDFKSVKNYIQFILGSHVKLYIKLYKQKNISLSYLVRSIFHEIVALFTGLCKAFYTNAFFSTIFKPVNSEAEHFRGFMRDSSYLQPAVDPINGNQANIQLVEPPLRVALLSYNYPPKLYDGVGRSTHMLAKGLFALGHTVHVLTHGERQIIQYYDGAYVHHVPYELKRYASLRHLPSVYHRLNYSHAVHECLLRLILNDDIQIVDTPLWLVDGFVTAISKALPVVVRPVTANKQISELVNQENEDQYLLGEIERQLLLHASIIAANSKATRQVLYNVYNLDDKSRIEIVPYGIEPVSQEQIRPFPYHSPPEKLTVLYVGRLEKRKGIQDLFAAIPHVIQRVPNVEFIIAGADNSIHDGFQHRTGMDYFTFFSKSYPESLPRVRFLGEVSEEQLNSLYQNCDLFVAPSLYESFGLIYLEAMNYAKPVIGCRAGGIPEVVNDGVTGRLVDPNSPKQLAEAIVTMLRSPRLLYEYGLAGRQRLLDYFTHIHMARGFERIYRLVLSQTKAVQ